MVFKSIVGAVCACLIVVSFNVSAVIIGNKDWLQVTDTAGRSWSDFNAIFDDSTGVCDTPGCLLAGGVDLTGYTWASITEVRVLLDTYTSTALDQADSPSITQALSSGWNASLFGDFAATNPFTDGNDILGFTRNSSSIGNGDVVRAVDYGSSYDPTQSPDLYRVQELSANENRSYVGGWFYKDAVETPPSVPIPASVWLFGSGLIGLIGIARRKKT
jgi:hypothetical protein